MSSIPAVCDTCGALFFANNIVRGEGGAIFKDCRLAAPCSVCGGVCNIIDGFYDATTNITKLLISATTKPQQLKTLELILRNAKKKELSNEQINARVEREVPELQSIGDCLPKTRMQLYAFITIILGIIALIPSYVNLIQSKDTVSEDRVKEIIDRAVREKIPTPKPKPVKKENKKIGRNDPCHCGSGKKYKKCCLI